MPNEIEATFKPGELHTVNPEQDVIRHTPFSEPDPRPIKLEWSYAPTIQLNNPVKSNQAGRVLNIARGVLDHFLLRNADYGEAADELGSKAQFVDMNRKFKKLKAGLWEGQELVGEPVEEILYDLIGHCLLTLDIMEQEKQKP